MFTNRVEGKAKAVRDIQKQTNRSKCVGAEEAVWIRRATQQECVPGLLKKIGDGAANHRTPSDSFCDFSCIPDSPSPDPKAVQSHRHKHSCTEAALPGFLFLFLGY